MDGSIDEQIDVRRWIGQEIGTYMGRSKGR
jgi:hypothetical protein